ncbi:MAG: hypothetical protein IPI97_09815 [Nitrosomonas sp.]|nr:hypothetical protein [Nitrosomonas sp.]
MQEFSDFQTNLSHFSVEIATESSRSLNLLQSSESTPSLLYRMTAQMQADAVFAGKLILAIQNLNISGELDTSHQIIDKLNEAQHYINQFCDELGLRYKPGDEHSIPENNDDHSYSDAVSAADNLHSIIEILCTVIKTPSQSAEGIASKFFVI